MNDTKYNWLNDDARLFLERGYLKEGVTPEERIWQIAMAAERYLEEKGFAEKFEDYMSRGWYSLASPIWANFGQHGRDSYEDRRSRYHDQDGRWHFWILW
jgi:ribonucleoside-diphosphate reductase alpha chain